MLAAGFDKIKHFIERYDLQIIAIFASIISSCIALSYQQPFNVDGIKYLNTATVFLQQGIHAAINVYAWAFYPILIGVTSKLTHLPLENSAFLLNTVFNTITLVTFTLLIKEFGGNRLVQLFGLITILVYPYLNHDRDNILRDFGYYAFALLSLLFFIRYLRQFDWRYAIAWGCSIALALLFRIEGTVILLLAPFAIFFLSDIPLQKRLLAFIKIHTITLMGGFLVLLALGWLTFIKHHSFWDLVKHITDLFVFLNHGVGTVVDNINDKASVLQSVFNTTGNFNSPVMFVTGGLVSLLIQSFLGTIGILYLALTFYAFYAHLIPANKNTLLVWYTYILLNMLVVSAFVFDQFFLAQRYIELLSLLLILAVPFSLAKIYQDWKTQKSGSMGKKLLFPLVCVWLVVLAVDSLGHFGPSKAYVTEAGAWIDKSTPNTSKLYSNDLQLLYYSHRTTPVATDTLFTTDDPVKNIQQTDLKKYDYLALVIRHDQACEENQILALLNKQPIQSFCNRRGDRALIFKLAP